MKNKSRFGFFLVMCIFLFAIISITSYTNVLVGVICGIILSAIITYILGSRRSMGSGSKAYIECINKINQNDLTFDIEELPGVNSTNSEILKKLMSNLKSNFKEQVVISETINSTSAKLTSIALELVSTMESVASSTEITSGNSEKQFEMLQEMKKDIEEVVSTISSLNTEMNETAKYASKTIESVRSSIKDTSEIQTKIEAIKELFTNIHKKINIINEYSEEVVDLNSSVHSIADQTSLLALNASIEAARAGEHGKGFAVVATEVSKLSSETNAVSKKIEDVISTLQTDLTTIVGTIEKESVFIDESYEVINKTILEFNGIQESLNNSMDKINNMTASIKEVSNNGEEIASNVIEITSFSEEITSQMEEASAQVQVQNQETAVLREVTDTLASNADQMLQNVANKVMEGQMLNSARKICDQLKNDTITNEKLNSLVKVYGVDDISIADKNGVVKYCSEGGTLGLELYSIAPELEMLIKKQAEFVATPIKKRVKDDRLYKYLSVIDNETLYQVGMKLESLTNF